MSLTSKALKQGVKLRRRANRVLTNASDRLFRSENLVLAGKTPFEVIHDNGLVSLRHYLPLGEDSIVINGDTVPLQKHRYRVPLVIVPPLAVNMLIYDLFPERSLVRYLLARGFDVYLIDWGKPGVEQTNYDFSTYIETLMPEFLGQVRTHSGQKELSLHGWSMGGVLALAYTALFRDPDIRNLVILGSPINTHLSGYMGKFYQAIQRRAEWVRENTGFRLNKLPARFFHVPGWQNTVGFKLTDPLGSLKGYWELVTRLEDREFVINHATAGAFLDDMQDYPGGVMRDWILRFWIDNELSQGSLSFGDKEARLSDIHSAVLAFAGESDNLVTADALRPLMDFVGSDDKEFALVPGGHMGIVGGSKAPGPIWAKTAGWLASRSS